MRQLFEAIGLQVTSPIKYFTGTASRVGGIGVFEIAEEVLAAATAPRSADDPARPACSTTAAIYKPGASRGEEHLWTP